MATKKGERLKKIIKQRETKGTPAQKFRGDIMQIRSKSLDVTYNVLDIHKKNRDALILLGIKGGEEAKQIDKLIEELNSGKGKPKEIKKKLETLALKQRKEDAKIEKEEWDKRKVTPQEKEYSAAEYLARKGMSIEQIQTKIGPLSKETRRLLNGMGYK